MIKSLDARVDGILEDKGITKKEFLEFIYKENKKIPILYANVIAALGFILLFLGNGNLSLDELVCTYTFIVISTICICLCLMSYFKWMCKQEDYIYNMYRYDNDLFYKKINIILENKNKN